MYLLWVNKMKAFILVFLLFFGILEAKEYKAVFDCSSSNASFIKSRMWLIDKTMSMIEKNGDTANFVITLHGGCVAMVAEDYEMIVPDEDVQNIKEAQKYLTHLIKEKGVKTTVCEMSLHANAMEKEDVLEFIDISENSFLDTISYQNDGYAIMTFK